MDIYTTKEWLKFRYESEEITHWTYHVFVFTAYLIWVDDYEKYNKDCQFSWEFDSYESFIWALDKMSSRLSGMTYNRQCEMYFDYRDEMPKDFLKDWIERHMYDMYKHEDHRFKDEEEAINTFIDELRYEYLDEWNEYYEHEIVSTLVDDFNLVSDPRDLYRSIQDRFGILYVEYTNEEIQHHLLWEEICTDIYFDWGNEWNYEWGLLQEFIGMAYDDKYKWKDLKESYPDVLDPKQCILPSLFKSEWLTMKQVFDHYKKSDKQWFLDKWEFWKSLWHEICNYDWYYAWFVVWLYLFTAEELIKFLCVKWWSVDMRCAWSLGFYAPRSGAWSLLELHLTKWFDVDNKHVYMFDIEWAKSWHYTVDETYWLVRSAWW